MTVDLKWHDAMAIASWAFKTHAERATGWPESMTPRQLAALQRPWVRTEPASKSPCEALILAIHADCDADRLPHTTTSHVVERQWTKQIPVRFESMYWDEAHGKFRTARGVTDVEVKTHHIEAAPFAEWLRTQGEEPSQHIAHWFKVRGVATGAQVLELVQPASATPATWTELLTYHRANEGHEWTPELKTIIAREHARRQGEKGLAKAMANELGLTASRLNELIRKKDAISIRKVIANRRTGT